MPRKTPSPSDTPEVEVADDLLIPVSKDYSQKPQAPIRLKPGISEERPGPATHPPPPVEVLQQPPAAADTLPVEPAEEPAPDDVEAEDVYAELDELRAQVAELEQRIEELEQRRGLWETLKAVIWPT